MPRPSRVLFVDLARSAAVLFMVQGHTLHALLDPRYGGGIVGDAWLYLRGLTSCAFLTLSGFSFSLATDRYWDEYRVPGKMVARRLARYGLLLVLGYGMRFPAKTIGGLATVPPDGWQAFAVVDILQLVAVTLAALQAAVWLAGSRERFMAWTVAAAAAVALATPLAWESPGWSSQLPLFVRAYMTVATGSIFPALPWAAYVFLGAGTGIWFARRGEETRDADAIRTFARVGIGMIAAGVLLHLLPWSPLGRTDFWTNSPNLFLVKFGSVLLGLSAAVRLTRMRARIPRLLTVLSRESLLVYLGHVALLYGSVWTVGLAQTLGPRYGPGAAAAWVLVLLALMSLLAWIWHECKRQAALVAALVRVTVLALVVYAVT